MIILTAESDPCGQAESAGAGRHRPADQAGRPERAAAAAAQRARVQSLPGSPGGLRSADRTAESQEVPRRSGGSARAQRRDVVAGLRPAAHRSGSLQAGERLPRPSHRRPPAVRSRQGPGSVFASFKPSHATGRDAPGWRSPAIGGNGFAALLPDLHNLTKVDDATAMARRVQNALSEPFEVDGHKLRISASIGIAVSPGDGEDADALLKNAEVAMYQAKQRGRKTYTFFSDEMNAHAARADDAGRAACARPSSGRVRAVLPAQGGDRRRREITGAEALLRWRIRSSAFSRPHKFIPIAEETGLIVEIGQWVLRTACAHRSPPGTQQGLPRLSVSVNVSAAAVQERHGLARGARRRRAQPDPAAAAGARADREHVDGRRRRDHLHAARDQGNGRAPVGGRLRHRLLVAHVI